MTRTERTLSRHWRGLAVLCALVALAGVAVILWQRIDSGDRRADQLAAKADRLTSEADLRGTAVSTLAADVRVLRAQIEARGETPAAPDPSRAVAGLPDRIEVPVPIPGAPGQRGQDGKPGSAGKDGLDGSNGADGTPGADGADGRDGAPGEKGDPGEKGEKGDKGDPGERGPEGPAGASCEDGYSWQTPDYDPDARICRKDGAPPPDSPGLLGSAALDPSRRQYP